MQKMNKKIKQLNHNLIAETERINNAANRLNICDNYGRSISIEHMGPDKLQDVLKVYNEERNKIFSDHQAYAAAAEKIEEEIAATEKDKIKLAKILVKAKLKEVKTKKKAKDKAIRKKAEVFKEKQRIKKDRESFWAKKVYRITIFLEASNIMTPGSSRRSSVTEGEVTNLATTTFHEPMALKDGSISISISYVTYSACWSPRYDLNLNSIKRMGVLEYSADLKNGTSETWRDAKIILSTSQTTFSGLGEEIPTLDPWHVRLVKGIRNSDIALMSQNELDMKRKEWNANVESSKPRHLLFGLNENPHLAEVTEMLRQSIGKVEERGEMIDQEVAKAVHSANKSAKPFGIVSRTATALSAARDGLLGTSRADRVGELAAPTSQFRPLERYGGPSAPVDKGQKYEKANNDDDSEEEMGSGAFFDDARAQDVNSLVFEEGAWEESGMTTTYDVPGLKTLAPSNSTIKHKLARVDFKNVIFSHIIIGKLRQVAFLKARLRNSSKLTLLKGPLGLSLDGSFLGQATFPRCSAGETISIPLGVDPAIQIIYTKPTVRRSQSGIFSKEDSNLFTRSITIINTKNDTPVAITVLDQVPVSEDERLRIEINAPHGLRLGSKPVRTGSDAASLSAVAPTGTGNLSKESAQTFMAEAYGKETGKEVDKQVKWGAAEALAKKGGEIAWNVRLNPGCSVKLVLEYEATFPGGESMIGI